MPLINLHNCFDIEYQSEPFIVYDALKDEELIEMRTKITAYLIISALIDRLEARYY
jgi:hypothetical protein